MVGSLPLPLLVCADTHCLQTSPAPSDLHCHCCTAAAFFVMLPLPWLPRCHCLPCCTAATAFLAAWLPLLSCLPCCAAADPSQQGMLRPSPCLPFCNPTHQHPCRCCCRQEKAWPATWGDDEKNTAVDCIIMQGGDRPGGDQRTPACRNKYMMRFNMQQRGNPQSAMCVRSILLELYKIQESAEINMVGP
jgi:hypothetical protein